MTLQEAIDEVWGMVKALEENPCGTIQAESKRQKLELACKMVLDAAQRVANGVHDDGA